MIILLVERIFERVKDLNQQQNHRLKSEGTLPETNIAPENGWLEYYFPFGKAYFQGLC